MQPSLFAPDEVPDATPAEVTLAMARPYQLSMSDSVMGNWRTGPRCMGVAATGVGKTFAAAHIINRVLNGELDATLPGKERAVLFINQRIDLVQQCAMEFATLLPSTEVEIEQGDDRANGNGGVVSACLESLSRRRLTRLGMNRFQAIVFDECHRYGPRNKGFKRVIEAFGEDTRILGLTATADRGDGIGLSNTFHRLAFEFGIWEAVQAGYLVPPYLAYEITGDIKLEGLPLDATGEFDSKALGARMAEAGPVAAVVKAAVKWSNYANGRDTKRPTVVCCAGVPQAKIVAMQLNEWDRRHGTGRAGVVHGDQTWQERAAVMRGFREGSIQYICHFDVLTEGFDSDRPKVMVNGRPCKARWVFAQNVGRILRPLREVARQLWNIPDAAARRALIAGSSKPGAMIVDVAGVDHKLAVDLLSVFNAPDTDPLALNEARTAARNKPEGKPLDPLQMLAEGTARLRDVKLAAKWKGIKLDAELTTRMSDPFDVFAIVPGREPRWFKGKRPTEGMRGFLEGAGIPKHEIDAMTFYTAKRMCDVVSQRRDAGMATYKQARLLKKFGFDGNGLTKEEASAMIDRLAKDGWKQPGEVA